MKIPTFQQWLEEKQKEPIIWQSNGKVRKVRGTKPKTWDKPKPAK